MAAQRLLGVVQKDIPWQDRTAAIKILQTDLAEIRDQVEEVDRSCCLAAIPANGRGLDFLYNPNLVSQPEVAYQIMSAGMRTGQMFANGMRISRFICGCHCDYPHARQMVNGMNNADEIAEIAIKFESILLASKHALLAEGPS